MVQGGNGYLLADAAALCDIPAQSSRLPIMDEEVPFFQMVVHGALDYTGESFNLFHDAESQWLKLLEYGYLPHFTLTRQEADSLKYTAANTLFSCRFADWKDTMQALYLEIQAFAPVRGSAMVSHESRGDTRTVAYANGWRLYINYGEEPAEIDGIAVEACGYRLIPDRGGKDR